jgi:hypothetical protein
MAYLSVSRLLPSISLGPDSIQLIDENDRALHRVGGREKGEEEMEDEERAKKAGYLHGRGEGR